MNLTEALKYGAVADFHSGDKRDQFAGLLEETAKGLHPGILADFAEDHNHPLAPVFRRIANGEAVSEGPLQDVAGQLLDNTFADPQYGFTLHSKGSNGEDPYAGIELQHHFEHGPVWVVQTHSGWRPHPDGGAYWPEHSHSWILPATDEELNKVEEGFKEDRPLVSEGVRQFRDALTPAEAERHRTLHKALKYITAKPEEWTQHLADPEKHYLHPIWADLLEDNNHPSDLADRVRLEHRGAGWRTPQVPNSEASSHDTVLHLLNHKHPSPAIRALAVHPSEADLPLLIDALRQSNSHSDQDAGVFLSPSEQPHAQHPARGHFKQLEGHRFANAGLFPKLVGDTLYLMDWEHPEQESYGAPAIRYHAPVSDPQDLAGLLAHAETLRQQREGQ